MENIITKNINIAASSESHSPRWLIQTGAKLPYGDKLAMMTKARDEGLSVQDLGDDSFIVGNRATMTSYGVIRKLRTNNL